MRFISIDDLDPDLDLDFEWIIQWFNQWITRDFPEQQFFPE
jgi:hypothetical protein